MGHDFHLHAVELQNTGPFTHLALASLVVFAPGLLAKLVQSQMLVMGDMSLGGTVMPVQSLTECLQVAFDAVAKKVVLPMSSAVDISTILAVPQESGLCYLKFSYFGLFAILGIPCVISRLQVNPHGYVRVDCGGDTLS